MVKLMIPGQLLFGFFFFNNFDAFIDNQLIANFKNRHVANRFLSIRFVATRITDLFARIELPWNVEVLIVVAVVGRATAVCNQN